MPEKTITAMFVIVAILHLLPVAGAVSTETLTALYGVAIQDPSLEVLMRHRAILLGLLGAFLLWASITPELQPAGFVSGFVSVLTFMGLVWSVGDTNTAIRKVFMADVLALVCLIIAVALFATKTADSRALN